MSASSPGRRYPAGLFDLPQDIARELPLDLVELWVRSDQTTPAAAEILEQTVVQGTTVVSDAAGLTSLTRERGLIEILALINRPKELIHACGTAGGGKAVGIWAADNTQMWYPEKVSPGEILSMLLAVQDKIGAECQVQVGMAAHTGRFYSIGGGLYGPEADGIEEVAENQTEGGEILVSRQMAERLGEGHGFSLNPCPEVFSHIGELLRLTGGPRREHVPTENARYPIPYSDAFYAALVEYQKNPEPALLSAIEARFTQDMAVVLVDRGRGGSIAGEAGLLEELALSVLMRKTGNDLLGSAGKEIKVVGTLGIYTFPDCADAVRFALQFRSELKRADVRCWIGVDYGPILVCELQNGGKDVSGMPVNVASKMAQDLGKMDRVYLTKAVVQKAKVADFAPLTMTASGFTIEAFEG